ncbi:MAG: HlyD family type I secretion periplasmic adaptor subunit [Pseudomonadota bacterium]
MVDLAAAEPEGRQNSGKRIFVIGWSAIVIVFGGILLWSVFAPFEGAVLASGSVSVETRHKAVQHLEGGIVSDILVNEGKRVDEGELLIRLDGTAIKAGLDNIDASLSDLLAREGRLIAERDGQSTLQMRMMPDEVALLPGLSDAKVSHDRLLAARADSRTTRVRILRQKITQLREMRVGLDAQVSAKAQQLTYLADEIGGLEILLEQGLAPKTQLFALYRERTSIAGEIDNLRAEMSATDVQIGEAELEIISLTDGFREEVIDELTDVQTELSRLLSERTAAFDRLSRLEIRAPRSGIALGMRAHTEGGVISAAEPILHIVPEGDPLVSLVRVLPQDIDKITVGQTARLRFSAFSQNETPEIDAIVKTVSADAVIDEMTGMNYYEVIIELPTQTPLGADFQIVPGMPVDAMLTTESRNVLSYLVKPLTDSMSRTWRE